jgi:hypothetical protein
MLTLGVVFSQVIVTDAEAGWINGVSRASRSSGCLQAKESITWDSQFGVVKRPRQVHSWHYAYEGTQWVLKHKVKTGWEFGFRAGDTIAHYWGTDSFSYPYVIGDHYTQFGQTVVYHGRTRAYDSCNLNGTKTFMYDNGQ